MAKQEKQSARDVWLMNLLNEVCVTTRLVLPTKEVVTGFTLKPQGYSFAFTSEYGSAWDTLARAAGGIGSLWNSMVQLVGNNEAVRNAPGGIGEFLSKLPEIKFVAPALTTATWRGSGRPAIDVGMLLINLEPGKNIQDDLNILLKCVLPTTPGFDPFGRKWDLKLFYEAPFGFQSRLDQTLSVEVGTWFKAHGLVMKSLTFQYSPDMIEDGRPLYCSVSMSLDVYQVPNYDIVSQWFTR